MPDAKALDAYYKSLTDQELLKLRADGGLAEEAERVLDRELAGRSLAPDEAKRHFAPEWLDEADAGSVGVLVLENRKRITAEVIGLNEDGDKLSVRVVSQESLPRIGGRSSRAIPLHQIVSFEPQPHLMERWPFSDPCRNSTFSLSRFFLMTTIFLCLILGSIPLSLPLTGRPYGLQEASVILYTVFVTFFSFAATGSFRRYMFTCPAVKEQGPRMIWRHLGFLVALVALQTAALATRPNLPDWWNTEREVCGLGGCHSETPFEGVLLLLCFGLAYTQVFTNRRLLDRAHRDFSA